VIVGHLGLAFAASAKVKHAPFALFVAAAVLPDVLDAIYALLQVCSPYGVYSHSLPVLLPLALLAGGLTWIVTRNRTFSVIAVMLVLSHLPLDWVTGRKTLGLQGPLVGIDLYRRPVLDFVTEVPLLLTGWSVARRASWVPRWATTITIVLALVLAQGTFNVLGHLHVKNPVSSQTPACQDTWGK